MRLVIYLGLAIALAQGPALAGDLELRATANEPSVESGGLVVLEATFVNTSEKDLALFLPLHVETINFPTWTLQHEDGRLFAPTQPAFQSMWKQGIQGEVLRLAPRASRTFRTEVVRVVPYDERLARAVPTQLAPTFLPPGRYTVVARYTKRDEMVPYSEKAFRTEPRRQEGVWTGRVDSSAVGLEVVPAKRFALTVKAPEVVRSGASYPVTVRMANETDEPLKESVALEITVGTKAYGSGGLRYLVSNSQEGPTHWEDATWRLSLAPGASREITLDLATFTYERDRPTHPSPVGLYDLVGTGTFHLGVRVVDKTGKVLTAAGTFRRIQALEPVTELGGLHLKLEASGHAGNRPRVTLTLVNAGRASVRVPATLTWPHTVFFSLARKDTKSHYAVTRRAAGQAIHRMHEDGPTEYATLPETLTWDGDRYEASPQAEHTTLALLAPGASVSRTFVVSDLLAEKGALEFGEEAVAITAYWRNRDSGARLELVPELAVGLLRSNVVHVSGIGW